MREGAFTEILQIPVQRFSCLVPAGAGAVDELGHVAGPLRRAGENAAARQIAAIPTLDHAAVLRAGVFTLSSHER